MTTRHEQAPDAPDPALVPRRRVLADTAVIAIVGGNTPYLLPFFGALHDRSSRHAPVPRLDLRVLGRDRDTMPRLQACARALVADQHEVAFGDDPGWCLDGADVVVVQPRVGGWAARRRHEHVAAELGLAVDEGLGVAGLATALRSTPVMRGIAASVRRRCPEAVVVGFTNPLASTVSVIAAAGCRVMGTCELPTVTASAVAALLGIDDTRLAWSLAGLNHRAFLHDLRVDHHDVVDDVVDALRERGDTIGGVTAHVIASLRAVPLKYHPMLAGTQAPRAGRAAALRGLRRTALDQLSHDPTVVPSSLQARSMPWHRVALAPLVLDAVGVAMPTSHSLELVGPDGVARSHRAMGDGTGWRMASPPRPPRAVAAWIDLFTSNEVALQALLADPSADALHAALASDPTVPADRVGAASLALEEFLDAFSASPVQHTWSAA